MKRIKSLALGFVLLAAGILAGWLVVPAMWNQGSSTGFEMATFFAIAAVAAITYGFACMWEAIKP
jgi:hypothetical protein